MVNMGKRIRALRLEKQMSQTELANRIGVSKAMLSSYELEQRSPSYAVLIKIAVYFNVTTDYLLGIEKAPSIKYEGLSDKEIRAVMNIVELLREK